MKKKYLYALGVFFAIALIAGIAGSTDPDAQFRRALKNQDIKLMEKISHDNPGLMIDGKKATGILQAFEDAKAKAKAKAERLAKEKAERLAKEKAERLAKEKAEQERIAKLTKKIDYSKLNRLFQRPTIYLRKYVIVTPPTNALSFAFSKVPSYLAKNFGMISYVKSRGTAWNQIRLINNVNSILPIGMYNDIVDYWWNKSDTKLNDTTLLYIKKAKFYVVTKSKFINTYGRDAAYVSNGDYVIILYYLELKDGTKIKSSLNLKELH